LTISSEGSKQVEKTAAKSSGATLKGAARSLVIEVLHAVTEQVLFRKLLHIDDSGWNKDGRLAGAVRRGDFDASLLEVSGGALEAQTAARDVLALNEFFSALGVADQSDVIHLDARMLAPIDARSGGLLR
jgi:hypothetical protein